MPFFSDSGPGGFQPKRGFRFLVSFTELSNLTFMVKDCTKPSYTLASAKHSILNHQFKFPGRVTWDDVTINFVDAIDPNVGSKFYNALLNSGYVNPIDENSLLTGVTKVQVTDTIGEVRIKQLDGGGILIPDGADPGDVRGLADNTRIVEEWTLKNAWLTKVGWGKLDYNTDTDMLSISTTITYDYATYHSTPGGIPIV